MIDSIHLCNIAATSLQHRQNGVQDRCNIANIAEGVMCNIAPQQMCNITPPYPPYDVADGIHALSFMPEVANPAALNIGACAALSGQADVARSLHFVI